MTSQHGSPDVGESVTISVVSGPASFPGGASSALFTTGPGGSVVATGLVAGPGTGVVTLRATVAGLPPQDITVGVAVPAPILAVTTTPPAVVTGHTFADLVATLTSAGSPVAGAPVTFTVTSGPAHFTGNAASTVANTDASGRASGAGLVATGAGTIQVTASSPGAADIHFTLDATAPATPTATLVFDNFNGFDQFTALVLQAQVENRWNSLQPASGLTIDFTVPNAAFDGASPSVSGANWSITGFVRGATTTVVTASYGVGLAPNGDTSTVALSFHYPTPRPSGAYSFTAVVSAANAAAVTAHTNFSVS